MDILIGADPEFFVRSKKTGELVSAHGLIAGTKAAPIPMGPGHAQVDGMALEINVPPSRDAKEFIDGFKGVMNALEKELPDYTFDFSPIAHFGADMIKDQPREARELGCEPDFNAYNGGKANPRPNADTPFRTASGHVHIGWTNEQDISDPDHLDACMMLSKQLDFCLGLSSLVWDADTTRRELYGKAGCYRPKHYGMEYRTLSNAWLIDNDRISFVVDATKQAFNELMQQINYGTTRGLEQLVNTGDFVRGYEKVYNNLITPPWFNALYKKRLADYNAAKKAELDRLAGDKAGKGDVNGKGFPANHLAKVAWGKRQIAFDMEIDNRPPFPGDAIGVQAVGLEDAWARMQRMIEQGQIDRPRGIQPGEIHWAPMRPMPAPPIPQVAILDDIDDNEFDFDVEVEDEDEEV